MSIYYNGWKGLQALKIVFIKSTQGDLQKCITQFKKIKEGRHEWNRSCNVNTLGKLNTPMKKIYILFLLNNLFICISFCSCTKYYYYFIFYIRRLIKSFFKETLQFKEAIILCYNKQNIMRMTTRMPPPLTWHSSQIIIIVLTLLYLLVFWTSLGDH
jgi:hypothetical protein